MMVELQARDPARNRARRWAVDAGPDLFGHWNARITYGQIGGRGRLLRKDFSTEAETLAFVRRCLRRRNSPKRRLQIRYRVTDASLGAWPLLRLVGLEEKARSAAPAAGAIPEQYVLRLV